jgi:orotidine-5'-phosphate decarboxylase
MYPYQIRICQRKLCQNWIAAFSNSTQLKINPLSPSNPFGLFYFYQTSFWQRETATGNLKPETFPMTRQELFSNIKRKQSYLCIGLDTDIKKIPKHLLKESDPIFEFNKQIIDATKEYCVSYKPNVAFYEALGAKGWESLQKTEAYFPDDIFSIADAKRGDIGNTSELYAKAFFEQMDFDSITVAPYMGKDSVVPFLNFKNKWVILLAHTSNEGSHDFQSFDSGKRKLYEEVIMKSQSWSSPDNMMYVVGATRADKIGEIRKLAPEHFFLVPGVGAQGGDLNDVSKYGLNKQCGLLVNSSRAIIYASSGEDFAEAARREAKKVRDEMAKWLDKI